MVLIQQRRADLKLDNLYSDEQSLIGCFLAKYRSSPTFEKNIESKFVAYLIVGMFIVSASICHHIAKRKQLNVPLWIVLGSLIGPLAIPLIVFAKFKNQSVNSS